MSGKATEIFPNISAKYAVIASEPIRKIAQVCKKQQCNVIPSDTFLSGIERSYKAVIKNPVFFGRNRLIAKQIRFADLQVTHENKEHKQNCR